MKIQHKSVDRLFGSNNACSSPTLIKWKLCRESTVRSSDYTCMGLVLDIEGVILNCACKFFLQD